MTEPALAALYRAVSQRLTPTVVPEVWGSKAYPDLVPANVARPYVIYAWAAGGELNQRVAPDAEFVLTVEAVSDTLVQAFSMSGRISALLNDADYASAKALNGGADWDILNASQEQAIHLLELLPSGTWIYREGSRFRFLMHLK